MPEVSLKITADTSLAEQQVKKFKDKLSIVKQTKQQESLISNKDLQNLQKMNQELDKFVKNFGQFSTQLQNTLRTMNYMTAGGAGGSGGAGGTGGLGGGLSGFFTSGGGKSLVSNLVGIFSIHSLIKQVRQGMDLIKQEEEYAAPFGTRIGTYGSDFRRTRLDYNAIGNQYNVSAMEAMQVANAYMSIAGTQNLRKNTSDILFASRGMGLDAGYLAQVFGMQGRMTNGTTDMRKFADLLAGAIKKSGMQGREQEFIDAVNNLTQKAYQNQLSVSSQDRNNIVGLLSYFGSKNPALRGAKGAEVAGGLDSLIRDTDDPTLLAIMGFGTKYKGLQGYWQMREQLSRGIGDANNLKDLISGINRMSPDQTVRKYLLDRLLKTHGLDNPQAVDFLMRPDVQQALMSGQITQDQLNQILKSGSGDLQQKFNNYMKSNAAQRSKWDVTKQNMQKSLGEPADEAKRGITGFLMNNFTPEGLAFGFTGLALGAKPLVSKLLGSLFGKSPRGGGGGGAGGGGSFWDLFKGGGSFDIVPPMFKDLLNMMNQDITSPNSAMVDPRLKQTGMTYAFGYGKQQFSNLFGWGTQSFRTLEAQRKDMLLKESDILKKREDLLNKEEKVVQNGGVGGANSSTLENVVAKLTSTTKDTMAQYTQQAFGTTLHMMQLGFSTLGGLMGGGLGGGGFTTVSYGSGSSSNLLNMNLKDGFNMTPAEVDAWINKNAPPGSVMRGQGAAFVEAARRTGLDVRYLVAHAAHETGWGTSHIAKTKNNFFGIGAVDWNPYGGAKSFGSTPAQGIIAGAEWIANNFINRGQNTLYSMLHGGSHSYASDPAWDSKIASIMSQAPVGTLNVHVTGSIGGLTPANNDLVANTLANKLRQTPDLSTVFRLGDRAVSV